MNPGPLPNPSEDVSKVANRFISAMKTEPLSLALVVMNGALLVLFYLILLTLAKQRQNEFNLIFDLLKKCMPPSALNKLGIGLGGP